MARARAKPSDGARRLSGAGDGGEGEGGVRACILLLLALLLNLLLDFGLLGEALAVDGLALRIKAGHFACEVIRAWGEREATMRAWAASAGARASSAWGRGGAAR